jgi:hypothetical protein
MAMIEFRDEFLSEEDLDLQSLTDEELSTVWMAWLLQAQITNDEDRFTYSHGVFTHEPSGADIGAPGQVGFDGDERLARHARTP